MVVSHAVEGLKRKGGGGGRQPRVCPACNEKLTQTQSLARHYARKHAQEKSFACEKCALGFATPSDCAQHQRTCLRGADQGKLFRCIKCGIFVDTIFAWKTHVAMTKHREFELTYPESVPPAALGWGSIVAEPASSLGEEGGDAELASVEWVEGGQRAQVPSADGAERKGRR